jgi:gallate dioxygenase
MWLVMRGALSEKVRCVHRAYTLPSMTGIATAVYEDLADAPSSSELVRLRDHADQQLKGIERLSGSYPFTIERSVGAYRLNKFLHSLVQPDLRAAFMADPEAAFESAGLTEVERDLVRRRDWIGLIRYGVIFFMLEKLGAVIGVSNLHIYASMRGQSLQDFQQTRNSQVLYSVAGKDAGTLSWESGAPGDVPPAGRPVTRTPES